MFTDPVGDAGTAPDVVGVSVTNDKTGVYSFDVSFATARITGSDLYLYLDTDLDGTTGDPNALGSDFLFVDHQDDATWSLYSWKDAEWVDAPSTSVHAQAGAQSLTVSIDRAELARSESFDFYVVSIEGDGSDGHVDDAPSGEGAWHYDFQEALRLAVVAGTAFPVKAGGAWRLALVARRSDTGDTVGKEGALTCRATSGGRRLALVTRAFVSGGKGIGSGAVCAFRVPKRLQHRVLHGTITIGYRGTSVTRSFRTTVR